LSQAINNDWEPKATPSTATNLLLTYLLGTKQSHTKVKIISVLVLLLGAGPSACLGCVFSH
jgi:hypothetical protein